VTTKEKCSPKLKKETTIANNPNEVNPAVKGKTDFFFDLNPFRTCGTKANPIKRFANDIKKSCHTI
jgi:hypothetical protein